MDLEKPLFGETILLTRTERQQETLRTLLENAGANVVSQPTIEILPLESLISLDSTISKISEYDWIVFSSSNGVKYFTERVMFLAHEKISNSIKLLAVGSGTATALKDAGYDCIYQPESFTAEGIVEFLKDNGIAGQHILSVRASRGRNVLSHEISKSGATIDEIVAYRSVDIASPDPEIFRMMQTGDIDWITVTSSSIACSLQRMFGDLLNRTKIISIGPVTSKTLSEIGITPILEAEPYTVEGIYKKLLFWKNYADKQY